MRSDFYKDNLLGTSWLGEVVDIDDPLRMGRARVRVWGKFDELEVEHIPWANQGTSTTAGDSDGGGSFSVPKMGSTVAVTFSNGDVYCPEYRFSQEVSKAAREEVRDSYENAHVLLYDTVTEGSVKIFFTEKRGLVLDYKGTRVSLGPQNEFELKNPNGDSVKLDKSGNLTVKAAKKVKIECTDAVVKATKSIHLDCAQAASIKLGTAALNSIVLGEPFMALFNAHVHIGNLGYPTLPPITPMSPAMLTTVTKAQ